MKNLPRRVEAVILAMIGPHYYKLCGLRMRCHSSVYACEGTQANTFGNKMCIYIKKKFPTCPPGALCLSFNLGSSTRGLGAWVSRAVSLLFLGLCFFGHLIPGICWSHSPSLGVTLPFIFLLNWSCIQSNFPTVPYCHPMPAFFTLFISISWFLTQTLLIQVMSELAWLQLQVSYHVPK